MLPDQPLGAVPVEALGGVSDAGEVHAGFTEENEKQTDEFYRTSRRGRICTILAENKELNYRLQEDQQLY